MALRRDTCRAAGVPSRRASELAIAMQPAGQWTPEAVAGRPDALESERDTLLGALAMAVPELSEGKDRVAVALARVEWLKSAKAKAPAKSARTTSERPAMPALEDSGPAPSDTMMLAIAAGTRPFTDAHREWCVGEAMVLSGFQFTPIELLEQGDAAIAQIIVDARKQKS